MAAVRSGQSGSDELFDLHQLGIPAGRLLAKDQLAIDAPLEAPAPAGNKFDGSDFALYLTEDFAHHPGGAEEIVSLGAVLDADRDPVFGHDTPSLAR
jgi:hypothetical protein